MEDRVLEIARFAPHRIGDDRPGKKILELQVSAKRPPHGFHGFRPRNFIKRDADPVVTNLAQIDAFAPCGFEDFGLAAFGEHGDGVEEDRRVNDEIELLQSRCKCGGLGVNAAGDRPQAHRPVKHCVHRSNDGQQHLRGADVGGGLLAPDMLLAGLQRQPVGLVAARIHSNADQPARHRALVGVFHRHIGRVRTAIANRHAKSLHRTDGDVGAHFTG